MLNLLQLPIELTIWWSAITIQVLFYILVFLRLNFIRPLRGIPEYLPPVSIIICAKNEAENLRKHLKVVLIQQYKQYEVIVVNDQSTDYTAEVLVEFYQRNTNLKIVHIPPGTVKNLPGKKHALLKGIEAASFETLVLTDADCRPATAHWLAKLVGSYMHKTEIVLGHSPFEKESTFLNKIIRYENMMTAMLYFGFAKLGLPYMGVGRNLSYKKSVLQDFKSFETHKNIVSGDDDILVNAKANSRNTEICIDKDAYTYSVAKKSLQDWLNQKRRHLRAGFAYKWYHAALLFLFSLSQLAFYVGALWCEVALSNILVVPITFTAILLLRMLILWRISKKLVSADLWLISPLLDLVYSLYLLLIFFLLLLQPKDKWT